VDTLLDDKLWNALIKFHADYECETCGDSEDLHAHHMDGNHDNNRLENGLCLCSTCHMREHRGTPAVKSHRTRWSDFSDQWPSPKSKATDRDYMDLMWSYWREEKTEA